jgi:cellulose synthase/poly-beta-1,6-N-acetylglucosamine synthase-like glycosyltransferase
MIVVEFLFGLLALVLMIPVLVFALQILIAMPLFGGRKAAQSLQQGGRPTIAVLVPAHNEGVGIVPTLDVIRAQMKDGDRLLVVADNCSDDTAQVAAASGAEVIERNDSAHRGKGYALDYGVRYLEYAPPDVLIIVDADCMVHGSLDGGGLETLAYRCMELQRPIQALYLMFSPDGAGLKTKVAEFAWAVKNWARAVGYARLGLPCQLMGTGMAFPWAMIQRAELASGHIVEDLKLGLDFAAAGTPPALCTEALVTSVFPSNAEGTQSQRTRWEHGHLGMMVKDGPRQLMRALRERNLPLLSLVLDMLVPPLALLTLVVLGLAVLGGVLAWVTGEAMPWALAVANLVMLGLAVLLAWAGYGRNILSFRNLAYAPFYALGKVPLYLKFVVNRQVEWVRSRRDNSSASGR